MWPHIPVPALGLGTAQLPSPAPHRLVIYSHLFLKLPWESVKTEPGPGASPLESFCSRQDSGFSTGQFWDMPRLVAGAEGHICTWLLHGVESRNKPFPLFPPSHCPCKTVKNSWKALGGGKGSTTLMWTQGKGGAEAST